MSLEWSGFGCKWASNFWVASESDCLSLTDAKQQFTREQEESIARAWDSLLSPEQKERFSLLVRVDVALKRSAIDFSYLRTSGLFEVRRLSAAVVDRVGDSRQAEQRDLLEKAETAVGFDLLRGDSLVVTSKRLEAYSVPN